MKSAQGQALGLFMRIVVVGGAGFIGSAVSRFLVSQRGATVLVIDKLTHAASLASLEPISRNPRYAFRKADIRDRERIAGLIQAFAPDAIVHAAVEKITDARIGGAADAVDTNLIGTWNLLEAAREYWSALTLPRRDRFRFLSVSSADDAAQPATAIRTAADQMVLSWHRDYGLPTIVSKAATTYGPYQFPNETVPAAIVAAMDGYTSAPAATPAREWLHIDDHVCALALMLEKGTPGESYTVAGNGPATSDQIAARIASLVERHRPRDAAAAIRALEATAVARHEQPIAGIKAVSDALHRDTGWRAEHSVETGLSNTVRWYLANPAWWQPLHAAQSTGDAYGLLRIA